MSVSTQQVSDLKIEGLAAENPFRPRVIGVTGGSYASSANFGAGVASTGNLDSITLRSGANNSLARTGASVHRSTFPQSDNLVEFSVEVSIDHTVSAVPTPPAASDEVRVSVVPGTGFGRGRGLPPASQTTPQPLFDAELKVFTDATSAPTVTLHKARLLADGNLAILQADGTTAVLVSDVTGAAGAAGAAAVLSVRGAYRGQ